METSDPLIPLQAESQPLVITSPHAMHHHAVGGRRVRPRPVNLNERLPVVRLYGGEEDLDPSLEAFLEAQEEERAVLRALEEGPKSATKGGKKQVSM